MPRCEETYDNPMSENLFSGLKTECVHSVKICTHEKALFFAGTYSLAITNVFHLKQNRYHSKSDVGSLLKV